MGSPSMGGVNQTPSTTNVNLNQAVNPDSTAESTNRNEPVMISKAHAGSQLGGLQWEEVPSDIIYRIFGTLIQSVFRNGGGAKFEALGALIKFGAVNITHQHCFQNLLKNHPQASRLQAEIAAFKFSDWKQQSVDMKNNCEKLRKDFSLSASVLSEWSRSSNSSNSSSAVFQKSDPPNLQQFQGVKIDFKTFEWRSDMEGAVSVLNGKVVKLDAKGIGRERFLNEVLPALEALYPTCQVILDVSNNDLLPEDFGQLVDLMRVKQVIYRLDISGNAIVKPDEASPHVTALFSCLGPLTHLYFENTGFNDATAQSIKNILPDAGLLEFLDLRNNPITASGAVDIIRGTFDPSLPSDYRYESSPRMCSSLQTVRLTSVPFGFDDDLRNAQRDFDFVATLWNTYSQFYINNPPKNIASCEQVFQGVIDDPGNAPRIAAVNALFDRIAQQELM